MLTAQEAAPAASRVQQAPVGGGGGVGHEFAPQVVFGPRHRPWAAAQSASVLTAQEVAPAASRVQQAPVGGGGGVGHEFAPQV
ncbi:MAG TPA: hypothetical protein VHC70_12065, partial [Phycisphaerales bacterium]|nr:hypothetical protein [Phycisphaerales bacterium]